MVHPQPLPTDERHPARGGRTGQVVLTVLGVLLIVVCAVAVTVVLLLSVGFVPFVVGTLAALLPAVVLVRYYLWLDQHEPEPAGVLVFAFAWGATVAVAGTLLFSLPPTLAVQAAGGDAELVGLVFIAPVVEEVFKALGLLAILLVGRRAPDGLVDGFVYAGLVGVGFAFTENILYLGAALLEAGPGALVTTFLLRGVVSPFAHPLFTAAFGMAVVFASRRSGVARVAIGVLGLVAAIVLHGLWNAVALGALVGFAALFGMLWTPLFFTFIFVARHARARESRMIADNVGLYARHGWFSAQEAEMLVSLDRRTVAVRAAAEAGPGAARTMRRFQLHAVRLAHLRQRMAHGTAPWDAVQRERHLLDDVAAARAELARLLPGGSAGTGVPA